MYVFGGFTGNTYLDDLYALQLSTQRWFKFHNEGPSPRERSYHTMASMGHVSLGINNPEPERNAVDHYEKTTRLARESFTDSPTEEQSQHPKCSSCEAHGTSSLQNLLQLTSVNSESRRVPEDDISKGSTEYHTKFGRLILPLKVQGWSLNGSCQYCLLRKLSGTTVLHS
ncbi:hypothetical protein BGY98DRAFT_1021320 [Russula aff. rugulosa BPL654]|nr:hypothetical protein BGY98DRAFT_1021320 [Russula aff. rugulosa BPL654]